MVESSSYRLWTEQEKNALLAHVQEYALIRCRFDWVKIAEYLEFRTPRQCMRQYMKLRSRAARKADGLKSEESSSSRFCSAGTPQPDQRCAQPAILDFGFDPLFC